VRGVVGIALLNPPYNRHRIWSRSMAVVITVAQQKGGTGKTTLVANIAAALAAERRVVVIDIDPQKSLSRWHTLRRSRRRGAAAITWSAQPMQPGVARVTSCERRRGYSPAPGGEHVGD
jgi:CobQ/CobB/MinD/ParA nucleotide binding domain